MPARRRAAAALVAAALTAGPAVLLAAAPAHATGGDGGKASAVVLRAGLDVSLLNKTVDVPLNVTLNDVQAPASAEKTALTVKLDSVDRNRPFSILRADVATAKATVDAHKAEGYSNLAHAKIHLPGLPLLSLIEVQQVTSKAVCEAGKQPYADSNLLGHVTVLGKKVTVSTGGTTRISVPAVGEVTLDLSKTHTTSRTAAATALQLKVSVNPLKLNVAEVTGDITLVEAKCESPKAPATHEEGSSGGSSGGGSSTGGTDTKAQSAKDPVAVKAAAKDDAKGDENLAETGGSSTTPYIAGGAVALVLAGGGALALARGRKRS
ncbi:LPXTG cell wall anchor domain-containing protein [Streptomyces sp. NBC_01465]|nr:SCO1860 family LAETG-anchored protein [Streptomyces sp. NBC_01465]